MSNYTDEIKKPDFEKIMNAAMALKESLQKYFGKEYLEKIEPNSKNDLSEANKSLNLDIFRIDKNKDPLYKAINSSEDLNNAKKNILEEYANNVVNDYWEYFDKVYDDLDENSRKSLEIIGKTFQKKQKKIESSLKKFILDDGWDIEKIQKEFSSLLQNILRDLLDSTIDPINNGMKSSGLNVYEKTASILNNFLHDLGVYTKEYKAGEEYSDEELEQYLSPRISEDSEIKDKSYQNKIESVDSLAYLFEDDVVIREANIVVWRIS